MIFVPADPMATLPFWKAHPFLLVGFIGLVVATFRTTLARAEHGATIPGRRIAVWGLGWMVVTILPVMMLTVGEHFLYLPSIGYSILVGAQKPKGWGVDAKELRSTAIVLGIVGVVCFARTAMFWGLSRSSARAIDETAAALDRAPQASRVFVADLPASAALAFPQAVRIERPGRSAGVEILSVVPRVFPDTGDLSQVTFAAPDRLEMRRENGYLTSYLERALEGPPHPYHVGQTFERDGYSVTITDAPDGGVRAFSVQLRDPEHTLILVRGEGGLETLPPPASR